MEVQKMSETPTSKGTDTVDLILVFPNMIVPKRKGRINWSTQVIEELDHKQLNLRTTGTRYNVGSTSHIRTYKKLLGAGYWAAIDVNNCATIDLTTGKVLAAGLKFKLDKLTLAAYYASKDVIRRNWVELGGAIGLGFTLNYLLKYAALMTGRVVPW